MQRLHFYLLQYSCSFDFSKIIWWPNLQCLRLNANMWENLQCQQFFFWITDSDVIHAKMLYFYLNKLGLILEDALLLSQCFILFLFTCLRSFSLFLLKYSEQTYPWRDECQNTRNRANIPLTKHRIWPSMARSSIAEVKNILEFLYQVKNYRFLRISLLSPIWHTQSQLFLWFCFLKEKRFLASSLDVSHFSRLLQ